MRLFSQLRHAVFFAFALTTMWPAVSRADDWPSRPITIVGAFPAGNLLDNLNREIARHLSGAFGQPVIVENKPGSGGIIASSFVAKAQPDGYTFLMTALGPAVLRPMMDGNYAFDMSSEFTPIIMLGDTPNTFTVNPQGQFTGIQDVIAFAKKNPGKLSIAHAGPGTVGHLLALLFINEANIKANLVPYKSPQEMITDLLGGRIDIASVIYRPAVKILAVTTEERFNAIPDVPTMKEENLPGVVGSTWFAIFAPAATPAHIVSKLNIAIDTFLQKDETIQKYRKLGFRILGGSPERLKQQIGSDRVKWSKVIEKAHLSQN